MPTSLPVAVRIRPGGVAFAESVHAADFSMAERSDDFHKLLLVQRGRIDLQWIHGRQRHQETGAAETLWIVPAGWRHRVVDTTPSVILLLCIGRKLAVEDENVRALWQHLESRAGRPLDAGPIFRQLETSWRRALLEDHLRDVGSAASELAIALQTLVAVARLRDDPSETPLERIAHLREQIEQTLYEEWTIDRAAKSVALSRRQFTKLFRRHYGRTFATFLLDRRLAYVEHLLSSGRHTVTGAAFSAGFGDLSHFYRLFKRRHGMPPAAWMHRSPAKLSRFTETI